MFWNPWSLSAKNYCQACGFKIQLLFLKTVKKFLLSHLKFEKLKCIWHLCVMEHLQVFLPFLIVMTEKQWGLCNDMTELVVLQGQHCAGRNQNVQRRLEKPKPEKFWHCSDWSIILNFLLLSQTTSWGAQEPWTLACQHVSGGWFLSWAGYFLGKRQLCSFCVVKWDDVVPCLFQTRLNLQPPNANEATSWKLAFSFTFLLLLLWSQTKE